MEAGWKKNLNPISQRYSVKENKKLIWSQIEVNLTSEDVKEEWDILIKGEIFQLYPKWLW